jgi:hypothetical protein
MEHVPRYNLAMNSTATMQRRQVAKNALSSQQLSDFAFRMPRAQREQMQAIAAHRGWSEAEAMRRAVTLFLDQNRDLLQVLCSDELRADGATPGRS